PVFYPNGAVYVISVDVLRRNRAFLIPGVTRGVEMPSIRSIDIDCAEDLESAESLHEATLDASLALGRHRAGGRRRCLVFAQLTIPDPNDASAGVEQVDAVATAGADAIVVPLPRTPVQQGLPDGLAAACRRSAAHGLETIGVAESSDAVLDPQCTAWGLRISEGEDVASLASRVSATRRPLFLMPERVALTTLVNVVAELRRVGVTSLGVVAEGSTPGRSLFLEAQAARFALRAAVGWSAEDLEGALAAVAAKADFVVLRPALGSRFQRTTPGTALNLAQVRVVTDLARSVATSAGGEA
ncbi:MAG TPA: hypothetical protein VN848_02560, partial [Gemmatimonadales bacterium]|nr:hypothetical protein [Gemmatimonadales bacterium]